MGRGAERGGSGSVLGEAVAVGGGGRGVALGGAEVTRGFEGGGVEEGGGG